MLATLGSIAGQGVDGVQHLYQIYTWDAQATARARKIDPATGNILWDKYLGTYTEYGTSPLNSNIQVVKKSGNLYYMAPTAKIIKITPDGTVTNLGLPAGSYFIHFFVNEDLDLIICGTKGLSAKIRLSTMQNLGSIGTQSNKTLASHVVDSNCEYIYYSGVEATGQPTTKSKILISTMQETASEVNAQASQKMLVKNNDFAGVFGNHLYDGEININNSTVITPNGVPILLSATALITIPAYGSIKTKDSYYCTCYEPATYRTYLLKIGFNGALIWSTIILEGGLNQANVASLIADDSGVYIDIIYTLNNTNTIGKIMKVSSAGNILWSNQNTMTALVYSYDSLAGDNKEF